MSLSEQPGDHGHLFDVEDQLCSLASLYLSWFLPWDGSPTNVAIAAFQPVLSHLSEFCLLSSEVERYTRVVARISAWFSCAEGWGGTLWQCGVYAPGPVVCAIHPHPGTFDAHLLLL